MSSRRFFIKSSLTGLALAGIPGIVSAMLPVEQDTVNNTAGKLKLRFAIASDGHYGQLGTPYKKDHENMVKWLNEAHQISPLNFVIINGDLVHDQPELLKEVKKDYYDRLKVPFFAIPGNHDHADSAIWKSVFGYEDNFSFENNGIGFILANTSNTKGTYIAPNGDFMKRELEKFKDLTTVFVILHIPPHLWVPESPFIEVRRLLVYCIVIQMLRLCFMGMITVWMLFFTRINYHTSLIHISVATGGQATAGIGLLKLMKQIKLPPIRLMQVKPQC
ncbi:metallophosphoesterase family protein [Pedobacter sp. NJ-S-72]